MSILAKCPIHRKRNTKKALSGHHSPPGALAENQASPICLIASEGRWLEDSLVIVLLEEPV